MEMIKLCLNGEVHKAHNQLESLWGQGYSAQDIIQVFDERS